MQLRELHDNLGTIHMNADKDIKDFSLKIPLSEIALGTVCIIGPNNSQSGAGFIASEDGLIVTCYHVIKDLLEKGKEENNINISIIFSCGDKGKAIICKDYLTEFAKENDVAILQIAGMVPNEIRPLILGPSIGTNGHSFETWGFPKFKPKGLGAYGVIHEKFDEANRHFLHLSSKTILTKFSGGPIFDTFTGWVVGITKSRYPKTDSVFSIPSEAIISICPKLEFSSIIKRWQCWNNEMLVDIKENQLNYISRNLGELYPDRDQKFKDFPTSVSVDSNLIQKFEYEFIASTDWNKSLQDRLANLRQEYQNNEKLYNVVDNIMKDIKWTGKYQVIQANLKKSINKNINFIDKLLDLAKKDDNKYDEETMIFEIEFLKKALKNILTDLADPRYGRCFLITGSFGSGKTHFIYSLMAKNGADVPEYVMLPIRSNGSHNLKDIILNHIQAATDIKWKNLDEFNKYMQMFNLYLFENKQRQFQIVICIDDLQKWISIDANFLNSLQFVIEDMTCWPNFYWLITLLDKSYYEVIDNERDLKSYWLNYGPLTKNFLKLNDSQELRDIGGWIDLDNLNNCNSIGLQILNESIGQENFRNLQEAGDMQVSKDLKNPLIALLFSYLYNSYIGNNKLIPSLRDLNYLEFVEAFWKIRKGFLEELNLLWTILPNDILISGYKEDLIDRSVFIISHYLSTINNLNFEVFQDFDLALMNFVKYAEEIRTKNNESFSVLEDPITARSIFNILEIGKLIRYLERKTDPFIPSSRKKEFQILFETFWEYWIARNLLENHFKCTKTAQEAIDNLGPWLSSCNSNEKGKILEFLLLLLNKFSHLGYIDSQIEIEMWHLGLHSNGFPPESVWFAGPKADNYNKVQRMLVHEAKNYNFINIINKKMYYSHLYTSSEAHRIRL